MTSSINLDADWSIVSNDYQMPYVHRSVCNYERTSIFSKSIIMFDNT